MRIIVFLKVSVHTSVSSCDMLLTSLSSWLSLSVSRAVPDGQQRLDKLSSTVER